MDIQHLPTQHIRIRLVLLNYFHGLLELVVHRYPEEYLGAIAAIATKTTAFVRNREAVSLVSGLTEAELYYLRAASE